MFPLRVFFTLCFLALMAATVTTPLSWARFNFAPDASQPHQEISRHTFFEVQPSIPDLAPTFNFSPSYDLLLITQAYEQKLESVGGSQPNNWPILFSRIYRQILPSKSDGSDPSA